MLLLLAENIRFDVAIVRDIFKKYRSFFLALEF